MDWFERHFDKIWVMIGIVVIVAEIAIGLVAIHFVLKFW